MKVTVDADKLLHTGEINRKVYDLLIVNHQSSMLNAGLQFLLALFIVGFVAASIALDPTFKTLPFVGLILISLGISGVYFLSRELRIVAQVAAVVGALVLSGWVLYYFFHVGDEVTTPTSIAMPWLLVAGICLLTGLVTRTVLLVGIAVLATTPILNIGTVYQDANYGLLITQPLNAALIYTLMCVTAWRVVRQLSGWPHRAVVAVLAVSFFLVNLALWVGSVWGDQFAARTFGAYTPEAFAVLWAILTLMVGGWAYSSGKRWMVSLALTLLAINLYTQWWERLQNNLWEACLGFGLGAMICIGIFIYNNKLRTQTA